MQMNESPSQAQPAEPLFDEQIRQLAYGRCQLLSCIKYTDERQVYLARDPEDQQRVVLKVAKGQAGARLADEYVLLAGLSGGSFPRAKSLFVKDGYTCLIREYVAGITLRDYAETRQLSPAEAISYTLKALHIARQLHDQPVPLVHRDLSPGNFVLKPDGGFCLIDLDSVHAHDGEKQTDTVCLGTPGTAAPEQYGAGRSDMRADVFGLGKLLIYLLTGGYDLEQLEKRQPPKKLMGVIRRATQFDPAHRFASLAQLERALYACLPRTRVRRWPATVLAACLALAVGAFVGTQLPPSLLPALWVQATPPPTPSPEVSSTPTPEATPSPTPNPTPTATPPPDASLSVFSPLTPTPQEATPSPSDIVHFSSASIAQATEMQLGIPLSEITYAHLAFVETVVIAGPNCYPRFEDVISFGKNNTLVNGQQIGNQKNSLLSLDELALLPNLKKLCIANAFVTDLTPLRALHLTHLTLAQNPLSDLMPLRDMVSLQYLDICGTEVDDLSPLSGLHNLTHLRTTDIPAADLTPVCSLPIQTLSISGQNISDDVSVLAKFSAVTNLSLNRVPMESLPFVNGMIGLTNLGLFSYPAETLEDISNLSNVTSLYMDASDLKSLDGVEKMQNLIYFTMMQTLGADLEPLTKLPNLRLVEIERANMSNFAALSRIPSLRELRIKPEDLATIKNLPPEVRILE